MLYKILFALFILIGSWGFMYMILIPHSNYMIDCPIPEYVQDPPVNLVVHEQLRTYVSDKWGNPNTDGPDRCMPETCYWKDGKLHCSERALRK